MMRISNRTQPRSKSNGRFTKHKTANEGFISVSIRRKCRNSTRAEIPSCALWAAGLEGCIRLKFKAEPGRIVFTGA